MLIAVVLNLPGIASVASGQAQAASVEECRAIGADNDRLACYDRVHGAPPAGDALPAGNGTSEKDAPSGSADRDATLSDSSRMTGHWELDSASKRGIFHFRPHRENYLVATYNPDPNDAPYKPFRELDPNARIAHGELAFQLGFKLKVAENPGKLPVDLWFGYTQRSFWQARNNEASNPFRESNYEPELMAVMPTDLRVAGARLRFLNLGLVHESNGGGSLLSRSWNRVYLQAGLERGDFQLLARVWERISEDRSEDDNPDITDYLGHGDLRGIYRWRGHQFTLLTRYNFSTDKGAAQLGWAFPVNSRLKGYLHYFAGYGYSLIDYNAAQRVLGLGVLVTY